MNLLQSRIVLRDRRAYDVLDLGLRFLVANRIAFGKAALVVLPPGIALTYLTGVKLGWFWGWTLAIFLGLLAQAPFTQLASRLVFEDNVRVRDVLRSSLARVPALACMRVLQLTVVAFAACLFVVPALLVGGFTFFLGEVMLLERTSVGHTVTRLQRLMSGSTGDAMLGLLLLGSLHVVATILGDVAGRAILEELFVWKAPLPMWEAEGGSVLATLGFWLFLPYVAITRFLLYLNVRTRSEGWDVQTRFSAIAQKANAEAALEATHTGRAA